MNSRGEPAIHALEAATSYPEPAFSFDRLMEHVIHHWHDK
jgi:hypothetical protein